VFPDGETPDLPSFNATYCSSVMYVTPMPFHALVLVVGVVTRVNGKLTPSFHTSGTKRSGQLISCVGAAQRTPSL
jgi:hypothetical protein